MKLLKLSVIALTSFLAVGCASTSDIDNLQGQINNLKTDVASTKEAATSANTAATNAANAANDAAETAKRLEQKFNNAFKASMAK